MSAKKSEKHTAKVAKTAKAPARDFLPAIMVETPITTEQGVLDTLPPAPMSTKIDLVVPYWRDPGRFVMGVSHKSHGKKDERVLEHHKTSNDTTAQWVIWNATLNTRKGAGARPMAGVLMNVAIRTAKPDFQRYFLPADEARAKAFIAARQVDWWLKASAPPTRSGNCLGLYGQLCEMHRLCQSPRFDALGLAVFDSLPGKAGQDRHEQTIATTLALARDMGYSPSPWKDRPNAPSPFGMSRYGVINNCGMEHYLRYGAELVTEIGGESRARDTGSAYHLLLAEWYRGWETAEDTAAWNELPEVSKLEALELFVKYKAVYPPMMGSKTR